MILESGIMCHVSEEDSEFVDIWIWDQRRDGYVVRYEDNKIIFLHLVIGGRMGILTSDVVDHKDRNRLNNQRSNLRPATFAQNVQNRGKYRISASKYIGVLAYKNKYSPWLAKVAGFVYGPFTTEEQAAKVRDCYALKWYGDFAVFNFPDSVGVF
jgi:hypothetical protein